MTTTSKLLKTVAIVAIASSLSGCAGTIVAGLTISQLLTVGSVGSTIITGKGLGEHAMDIATGKDCRIIEGVFRSDRDICEVEGSIATEDDFRGLSALLDNNNTQPNTENAEYALSLLDKAQAKKSPVVANQSLLQALSPADKNMIATSEPVVVPVRVELAKSVDNYIDNDVASTNEIDIDQTDLRKRLVFSSSYN